MNVLAANIAAHLAALDRQIARRELSALPGLREVLSQSRELITHLARERQPVDQLLDALRLWQWKREETLALDTSIHAGMPTVRNLIAAALNNPYAAPAQPSQ